MKPGKALHFLNQDPIWLIRALGTLAALIIPPFRMLFPEDSWDPMWIRWAISGTLLGLVVLSFFWKGLRKISNSLVYTATFVMSGWMLMLTLVNNLDPTYASSYFIFVFTSLILYRSWTWLITFMISNLLVALIFIVQLDHPDFNPWTFFGMQLSIFLITSLGLIKGFREFKLLSLQEEILRGITESSFEGSRTGILVTDQEGRVLHFNQLLAKMWNWEDLEAIQSIDGKWLFECQRLLSNPQQMLEISRRIGKSSPNLVAISLDLVDGRKIEVHQKQIQITEELKGWLWSFEDFTARHAEEKQLKTSRKRLAKQNESLIYLATNKNIFSSTGDGQFNAFAKEVTSTINAYRTSIWQFCPEKQCLNCLSMYFSETGHFEAGHTILRANGEEYFELLETERIIFIDNALNNPLTQGFKQRPSEANLVRSCLDIPLRSSGQLWGLLMVERTGVSSEWPFDEQQFAASVGDLIMSSIASEEKRKAETEARKSAALIKAIFELAGLGILVTSNEKKVLDFNQHYINIFGLDPEFVNSAKAEEVIAFCQAQLLEENETASSMAFLIENPSQNDAKTLFFKDGRIVERFTEVLRLEGEIIGRVWFYRDVTLKLASERRLVESETRNKAIINAIPDLILRLDLEGTVLDVKIPENNIFEMLDINASGHQNVNDIFPEDFAQRILSKTSKAIKYGQMQEVELELNLTGMPRDYELRVIQSGIGEVLMMLRDVTERKKTEKELMQRNHELDSFVYRASHDLKAPLNSLMGLIEILKGETDDAGLHQYIGLMDKSVIKLDTFIRNLTDFSRIARLQVQGTLVDFQKLIDEILEGLHFMQNADKLETLIEIEEGPNFIGDSFHIGIVLGNLISNSVKYMDSSKPKPMVKVKVTTEDSYCRILVEDNGLGIPKEHQNRIFELFFRATNQSFGSGLGLYITRNAIDKMGGTIEMNSTEGEGTRFTIYLPNLRLANQQVSETEKIELN